MTPIDDRFQDPYFEDVEYTPNDCPAGWVIPSALGGCLLCIVLLAFARLMMGA